MIGGADRFTQIGEYYDRLVEEHGHHHRACDYGRAESQTAKFRVLSEVADMSGKSVLDVGCGFADFADYLKQKYDGVSYSGVELSHEMVAKARELHPGLEIRGLNILEDDPGTYDIVTANGIFYLLGDEAWPFMEKLIRRMYDSARVAVAFNTLSIGASQKEEGEFYADPARVLEFCRTLTPFVSLRHDYLPHDFTVYMYRSAS